MVLSNPRLLRPFETLIRLLPLPQYGSIDPTPFVAVFFPAFFGLMVGDIGYGVILALLGLVLHARTAPGSVLARTSPRSSVPARSPPSSPDWLYGEFFGDLGTRWFGLRPLLFSREDAIIPFLLLALSLGVVHVLLALVLGAVSAPAPPPRGGRPRHLRADGGARGAGAARGGRTCSRDRFFTPAVIALLVAFPVLIALEGVVAMIELLTTLGNILSYARIMALGVASVMLAVVANRMVGAHGQRAGRRRVRAPLSPRQLRDRDVHPDGARPAAPLRRILRQVLQSRRHALPAPLALRPRAERVVAAAIPDNEAARMNPVALTALAAALAVAIPALATAWAQSRIGPAIAASMAEKPELSTTAILMIAIPETMVILGFVVSMVILVRAG